MSFFLLFSYSYDVPYEKHSLWYITVIYCVFYEGLVTSKLFQKYCFLDGKHRKNTLPRFIKIGIIHKKKSGIHSFDVLLKKSGSNYTFPPWRWLFFDLQDSGPALAKEFSATVAGRHRRH